MPYTDAQFKQMLRGKNGAVPRLLVEIEFAYQSAGALATGTIYLADGQYRTGPNESPANVRYRDVVTGAPTIERSIDLKRLGGRATTSFGAITLNNADGSLDFLLLAIVDGRPVRMYVGDKTWARADFRLVNAAVVSDVKATSDSEITIDLRDKGYLLDDTIIGSTMATGPNAGKPKPILLGKVKNLDLAPYLLDSANLIYCINDFAIDASGFVAESVTKSSDGTLTGSNFLRDSGGSLGFSGLFNFGAGYANTLTASAAADTLTLSVAHGLSADDVVVFANNTGSSTPGGTTLTAPIVNFTQYWVIASGLTSTAFKLSLTKGGAAIDLTTNVVDGGGWSCRRARYFIDGTNAQVQLSGAPAGRVTLDGYIVPNSVAGVGMHEPHSAFKYFLDNYATRLSGSDYDTASLNALITAETATVQYGRAILNRMNILDLFDEIATGTFSWYGWSSSGVLTFGRLDLANLDSATPIDTITTGDIVGELAVENLALQWGKVVVDIDQNVVQQADGILNTVSASDRSKWAQPFQTRATTTDPAGADYPGNWWDYHKSAINSSPMELVGIAEGSTIAQYVADAITTLFKPWTRAHTCTVGIDKYALNPGDCVALIYPRYGLSAGKNVRVVSVKPRFSDGLCDLVLVRQETPDYLTGSYA